MSIWSEIRNNYCDDDTKEVYIDAFLTDYSLEEGTVIAKISLETMDVEYLDEDAKTDSYAQEIIKETIDLIKCGEFDEVETV